MGKANGIQVTDIDLSDTQDVLPRYSDVVHVFQAGCKAADGVAQAWLDHMSEES